jgi:hypothetical protein
MTRSVISGQGKEHQCICVPWNKLCESGVISYVWSACDCSEIERNYQIKINEEFYDIKYCPFCCEPINPSRNFKILMSLSNNEY